LMWGRLIYCAKKTKWIVALLRIPCAAKKNKTVLDRIVTCNEKWIVCDNLQCKRTWRKSNERWQII